MRIFKAIAGIAVIFTLGVLSGIFGASLAIKHRIETFHENGAPPIKLMFKKRIIDRLDLSPSQRASVEKILDNVQIQVQEIRQEFQPKIKAAFDAGFNQVREILNDSQRKQMDLLLKDLPDRFPHNRGFRGKDHDKFGPRHRMPPPSPEQRHF